MHEKAGKISSYYKLSDCSIKQFSNTLFENRVLKSEYECLIKPDEVNLSNYRKQLNSIVLNDQLPGYMYSMSDQCRWITNDSKSYACGNFGFKGHMCAQFKCAYNGNCHSIVSRVLDGTSCGRDKICMLSYCVSLRNITNGISMILKLILVLLNEVSKLLKFS